MLLMIMNVLNGIWSGIYILKIIIQQEGKNETKIMQKHDFKDMKNKTESKEKYPGYLI